MSKPYSESCEQNRVPILTALAPRVTDYATLLEIGSGTGQHAVYLAPDLPHLVWQTSDRVANHHGIGLWLDEAALANVRPPLALDVLADPWPAEPYDAVFSANTAHIMPASAVAAMFSCVGQVLRVGGPFMLYGPFNYDGRFTSDSNARFDGWLRQQDPQMGIRDLAWLCELGDQAGLALDEDLEMPVNNRFLVWRRSG